MQFFSLSCVEINQIPDETLLEVLKCFIKVCLNVDVREVGCRLLLGFPLLHTTTLAHLLFLILYIAWT